MRGSRREFFLCNLCALRALCGLTSGGKTMTDGCANGDIRAASSSFVICVYPCASVAHSVFRVSYFSRVWCLSWSKPVFVIRRGKANQQLTPRFPAVDNRRVCFHRATRPWRFGNPTASAPGGEQSCSPGGLAGAMSGPRKVSGFGGVLAGQFFGHRTLKMPCRHGSRVLVPGLPANTVHW